MLKRYVALFAASLMLMTAVAAASNSNKWRLQFSGGADSDGTIVLRLTPKDGQAMEVAIDIEDGRSENGVAKDVTESLHAQLPHGHFHVERDDGEDVLIKRKHHDDARFDVKVVSNTVKGVRINPDHE